MSFFIAALCNIEPFVVQKTLCKEASPGFLLHRLLMNHLFACCADFIFYVFFGGDAESFRHAHARAGHVSRARRFKAVLWTRTAVRTEHLHKATVHRVSIHSQCAHKSCLLTVSIFWQESPCTCRLCIRSRMGCRRNMRDMDYNTHRIPALSRRTHRSRSSTCKHNINRVKWCRRLGTCAENSHTESANSSQGGTCKHNLNGAAWCRRIGC